MSKLSAATIRKFIRESFSETDQPIKVSLKQKLAWLKKQAEWLSAIENVSAQFREQETCVDVWVRSPNGYWEYGFFTIGFQEESTELVVSADQFYLDAQLVENIEELNILIEAIKKRFEERLVKRKQKSTTETFTLQGLKAQVYELCKQHGLDFCISKRSYWYLIFVRKPECREYLVIRINGSQKKIKAEFANLPKYVEYAAGHFEFHQAVQGVGGSRVAHINYGAEWVNCSQGN